MHFTMGPETILGIKKINFIIKYEKKAYLLMFDSCVYHVILAGHQILKLALNVKIFTEGSLLTQILGLGKNSVT